jgi:hypothetical protein
MSFNHKMRKDYVVSLTDTFMKQCRSFTLALSGSSVEVDVAYLVSVSRRLMLSNPSFGQDFLPSQVLVTPQTVARGLHIAAHYLAYEMQQRTGTVAPLAFPSEFMLTVDALRQPREAERRLVQSGLLFVGDVASADAVELRSALRHVNFVRAVIGRMSARGLLSASTQSWPRKLPVALAPAEGNCVSNHPMLDISAAELGLPAAKTRRLGEAGLDTVGTLARAGYGEILRIGNIGHVSLNAIEDALAGIGLRPGCVTT